jgi:hypothetical protein
MVRYAMLYTLYNSLSLYLSTCLQLTCVAPEGPKEREAEKGSQGVVKDAHCICVIRTYMCVCLVYVHMCICVYIYIYIYIH